MAPMMSRSRELHFTSLEPAKSYQTWGVPKIGGYPFGGPNNKDYSILGFMLGYPNFGKLPPTIGFRV